ncbi:MAG: hypothetical protein [Caudoviricetes sp.]|nr:MAG: hypothetical protein [Caudoviricetes sp.]
MSETYAVKAVLSAVDSNFLGTMDKAAKSVEGVAKASNLSAGAIGKSMAVAGTAITAMGLKALSGYGNFQKAINQAAIIAGGSAKDIRALSDEANRLGQTLPISAQDAADAMVAMARNGASVKDLKDDFPPIAKAAAATAEDLSSTATVVQQAMNLWGGGMKNATMYSAILTETANKSNATIGDMQQVLADVGNTAVNMHMDLRTLATSIGILTNSGIPAAQAAMDLNHALLRMQAPSDKAREEMQALGISYADAQGRMKPFPQILREVAQATNGMGDAQKSAALKTLFDAAGMNAMLPLLRSVNGEAKSGNVDWNTLSAALDKAGGSFEAASTYLDNATNQMQQNLGSRIDQMKDAFIGLQNSAMASTDGMVSGIVTALDNMFTHMQTSNDAISQLARGFIGLAPVVGPATIAIGTFLTNADKIQSTMVSAAKWLVSPWGLATVAIGLMAGALIGLYQNFQPFQGAVNNVVSAFQQGFSQAMPAAIQALRTILGTLKNDLTIIGAAIQQQIGGSLQSINVQSFASMFISAFSTITLAITTVVNALTQVIQGFIQVGALQSIWRAIGAVIGAIGGIIGGVIDAINNLIGTSGSVNSTQNIWQTLGTVIGNIINVIASVIIQISKIIKSISAMSGVITPLTGSVIAFIAAFKGISIAISLINTLKKALIVGEVIKGTIGDINLLKFALTNMAGESKLAAAAQTILNGVMAINPFVLIAAAIAAVVTALTLFFAKTQTGQQIWQQFTTFLSGVWNGLVSTAQTVFNGLASFFSNLWNGIVSTATSVWNGITGTLSGIWNGIVSTAQPIFQGLANFLSGLWNGIKDIAQGAWEAIKSVIMGPVLILIDLVTGDFKHLQSDLELIWNSIKSAASSIWNGIKTIFTTITTGIKNTIVNIWNGAKSLIINIWNGLKATGSNIVNAIKSIWTNGFNALKNFVVNVANAMVNGAKNAWNGLKSAANWIVDQVRRAFDALRHIDLVAAGKAIINSFLNGLKAAFKGVKNWIGGIGDWIRKHKGPIQYDRKLLIPAGNAIMQGLNFGLVSAFKDVQGNVSNMAKSIAESANNNLSSNLNNINAKLANGTINHAVSGQLEIQQQPAYIQLQMGDNTFNAYVDDITKQQNISLDLGRF